MSERDRRIARNESLFRAVNERLESLNRTFATITEKMSLVCECGNASCKDEITVATAEYRAIRADPLQFIVKPGHEVADVEEVVASGNGYDIVRKTRPHGVATAAETDAHL